jgi:hypothetical protein
MWYVRFDMLTLPASTKLSEHSVQSSSLRGSSSGFAFASRIDYFIRTSTYIFVGSPPPEKGSSQSASSPSSLLDVEQCMTRDREVDQRICQRRWSAWRGDMGRGLVRNLPVDVLRVKMKIDDSEKVMAGKARESFSFHAGYSCCENLSCWQASAWLCDCSSCALMFPIFFQNSNKNPWH